MGSPVAYQALRAGLQPDPDLTVSEWADQHRRLSSKSSAEAGQWRTSRAPYLREIQDSLSANDPTQRVVFMKGAQIGGTEAGNNWLGYLIHHAPGPILYVLPTVEIAERVSKQRIAPMLAESPVLAQRVAPNRTRDSGNTLLAKEFRGGVLLMTGSNSPAGLRSMPIKYLFMDEVDGFASSAGDEGDPIGLAEKRASTFARRKVLLVSTPTVKGVSRIEREYEKSDKRRYFVACPHCGVRQWLRWRGYNDDPNDARAKEYRLLWLDEDHTQAGYRCEADDCGALIEEHHKTTLLTGGEWRATAPGDGITRGYHLSALYSPAGWKSWVEILREFEEASRDPVRLKVFLNTTLGETFEESYAVKLDADGLASRAETYEMLTVPEAAVLVVAGVDVQRNRLAIVQRAFGPGDESWLVNHCEIYGDPMRPELWAQLLDVLDTPIQHPSGAMLTTWACAIDSGDGETTSTVYSVTRQHKGRHLLAIKGVGGDRRVLMKASKVDFDHKGHTVKGGATIYLSAVDTFKAMVHARIEKTGGGPGAYHWPQGLSSEYWQQLVAEVQVTRTVNGFTKRVWVKKSPRNEALDCEVYCLTALEYVRSRHNPERMYAQLRERIDAVLAAAPPVLQAGEVAPAPVVRSSAGKISLDNWRRA
jgi:phage terminase large subunit GpA-like protein